MFFLRFLTFTILSIFLIQPKIVKSKLVEEKPILVFAQDNSKSIVANNDSNFYKKKYSDSIKYYLNELSKYYDVRTCVFGSEVKSDTIFTFSDNYSNFENLYDFCARVDLSKVDKRGIEPLIKCGAMDSFNLSRKEMLESLEDAMKYAKQNTMTQESGISDLFGGISESNDFIPIKKDIYDDFANSKFEFSALGFYLETHPVKEHYWELKKLGTGSIENVLEERVNTISGVIIRQNRIQTRRGPLVFATLDDWTDRIELVISSEVLDSFEGNFNLQTIYIATGDVTFEKDAQKKNIGLQKKMRVIDIKSLEEARMKSVTKYFSFEHLFRK